MSKLTELIEAQRKAKQEYDDCDYDTGGAFEDTMKYAEREILEFVLDHAVDIAERERLEASVVEAYNQRNAIVAKGNDPDDAEDYRFDSPIMDLIMAQDALTAFLVARAEVSQ